MPIENVLQLLLLNLAIVEKTSLTLQMCQNLPLNPNVVTWWSLGPKSATVAWMHAAAWTPAATPPT